MPNKPAANRPRPSSPPAASSAAPDDGLMRLSKRLADLGWASRREADEWIERGWVKVNGSVAVLGQKVTADAQIDVSPAARAQQHQQVTILLHKPVGYVSGQAEDGHRPAVTLVSAQTRWPQDALRIGFERQHLRGLAPAGRLDIDSTGLLVLTQDGRVARQLIGEDSDVEKEYLVRVMWPEATRAGPLPQIFPPQRLALLNHGLQLDGRQLRPAQVEWLNDDQLRFVLREGRKRQIRRMCELVGLQVLGLKRVRIGRVQLGRLPVGLWRYLRDDESFA